MLFSHAPPKTQLHRARLDHARAKAKPEKCDSHVKVSERKNENERAYWRDDLQTCWACSFQIQSEILYLQERVQFKLCQKKKKKAP